MLTRPRLVAGLALVVIATAVVGTGATAAPAYVDTAAASGIDVGNVLSFGNPCVVDLNADGIDDLVIDRHNPVPWDVYLGRADGTFVPMPSPPARRVDTHDCASGDFNRDGLVDLYGAVGACQGTCARTDDLWLQGPSGWTLRNDLLGPPTYDRARESTVADLDGDGWLDVAVVSAGGGVGSYHDIYWNQGEVNGVWQGFKAQKIAKAQGAVDCVEAADVTGDGKLDLILCQRNGLLLAAAPSFVPTPLGISGVVDVVITSDGRWLVTRDTSFEIWAPDRTVTDSWPLVAGADAGLVDFDNDGVDEIVVVQGTAGHPPDDPAAAFVLENRSGVWTRVSIPQPATGAGAHVARVGNRALILNGGIDRTIPLWDRKGPRQLIGKPGATYVVGPRSRPTLGAGDRHTCAVRTAGTVRCWGRDDAGQLGDDGTVDAAAPVAVKNLTDAVAVVAGAGHSCALRADRTVACWGRNDAGQLGDGTTTQRHTPVAVSGLTDVLALTAGDAHTCASRANGSVWCWGDNAFGQLGDGTTTQRHTPVAVSGPSGVVGLTAGAAHTCALSSDGSVGCWGRNASAQLGDGTTTERHRPVAPAALTAVAALAAGGDHTCAVLGAGTVRCWGDNNFGQVGIGSTATPVTGPAAVTGLTGVVALAAGTDHTCAVRSDRTAACWGRNDLAQLGSAAGSPVTAPAAVSGVNDAVAITAGSAHSCFLATGGTASCFGSNADGRSGNGVTGSSATPQAVTGLSGLAPPVRVPSAPRAVTGAPGDGRVDLVWAAPADAGSSAVTDYTVQSTDDGGTTWTTFADAVSATTAVAVTGLTNGTSYRFRVTASNAAGQGLWSAVSSVSVPTGTPGAPTGLVAVAGSARAMLSWFPPAGTVTVTDYVVEYNVTGSPTWTTFADGVSTATSATVTGLTNGTSYTFRVAARNGAATGPTSAVSGPVVPSALPSTPTAVVATAGVGRATLAWTAPAGGGPFSDYVVQYSVAGTGTWTTFADGVSPATTATVTGLTKGTFYRFKVAARNGAGRGPFSAISNTILPT